MTYIEKEIGKHFFAENSVINLGMELHAVKLCIIIGICRYRAGIGCCDNLEPFRRSAYIIGVAHPAYRL